MSRVIDNGKEFVIEDGKVVSASIKKSKDFNFKDRVLHGKKLGSVVSKVPSIYGDSIGVRFDDGSFSEYLAHDLEPEPLSKEAAVISNDEFEEVYEKYNEMSADTLEDVEAKMRLARSLNLRAKALATNHKNTLADTIFYDRVVTATAVDLMDLEDERESLRYVSSADYLEALPRASHADLGSYVTSNEDASWIQAIEEPEPEEVTDAHLASLASKAVDSLNRDQLEDNEFIRSVLQYQYEYLPQIQEVRTRFASYLNQARQMKLAQTVVAKTASVGSKDMDGNDFSLEDTPVEAIFGA